MKDKFTSFYIILAVMAVLLIFTGIFLNSAFMLFHVKINRLYILIMQIAFILSGIADFALIIYAKKKLS